MTPTLRGRPHGVAQGSCARPLRCAWQWRGDYDILFETRIFHMLVFGEHLDAHSSLLLPDLRFRGFGKQRVISEDLTHARVRRLCRQRREELRVARGEEGHELAPIVSGEFAHLGEVVIELASPGTLLVPAAVEDNV